MSMTHKERTVRALTYQPVDRLPTQVNYTQAMGEKLAAHFGVSLEELPNHLDNHLLRVDINYERPVSHGGEVAFDWWGVGFDTQEEGYFTAFNPLAESKDLDTFAWPDPHQSSLLGKAAQTITAHGDEFFITPNLGWALFERAWSLRGFDTLLMDMVLDPGFVEDLLDRISAIQLILIRRFIDLGVDGGYFGDDYGAQKNMLFSPQMWRQMIKPRLARLFAPFREAGLPVIMHSDGQIADILPELVEIGLTCYNPVQPEVINHTWLRNTFGERLAYYGGVSTQSVLPNGTPEDVRRSVAECVERLAPDGSGLLLAPSHRLMQDIPLENVAAMLNVFATLR